MFSSIEACEEKRLIAAAQNADDDALDILINRYMPMIVKLSARFRTVPWIRDELIQAGCEGLMKAIRKYSIHEQAKLSTYAFAWIVGEMKSVLRRADGEWMSLPLDWLEEHQKELHYVKDDDGLAVCSCIDLRTAFGYLSEEDKRLIYCRYFMDLTQKETAERLKKSQSYISKAERRILEQLRLRLS